MPQAKCSELWFYQANFFLALFCPGFFLSLIRGSLIKSPAEIKKEKKADMLDRVRSSRNINTSLSHSQGFLMNIT